MRLVNNPDSLDKCTHIILDEVHERDLDIDFSMVVIKHLLARTDLSKNALKFKLILMSATFNTELFANYFASCSIKNVENVKVYVGVEEQYEKEERERNLKLSKDWGRAEPQAWDKLARQAEYKTSNSDNSDDDAEEWIDDKKDQRCQPNPVKRARDPADIVNINERNYRV